MNVPDAISAAASQAWPAFALVTGLLLVGVVADRDGLFAAAGGRLSQLPLRPRALLVAALGLVAVVTAVLNLDTAVFFLTPVLLHLARHRGIDEAPFLYGTVFMSNAASLFLPGSNLTNLIVLHHERVSGATFLARMWPAAIAAVVTTTLILTIAFWRTLGAPAAVSVGSVGRWWHGPEHLVNSFDRWQTAATGALGAICLNNLPAAMLLSANVPAHSRALLIGLNLGPNLAVTGSLSAVLWLRVARSNDARPSARTYTLLGLVVVPVSIAASLAALAV